MTSPALMLATAALAMAGAAIAKPTAPVTGALAASDPRPGAGARVVLYVNVTAEADVADLRVALRLPEGVTPADDAPTSRRFGAVPAGETRTLVVPVLVRDAEPHRVLATATLADAPSLALGRDFVLDLNPAAPPAPAGRPGTDAQGRPLTVYPSAK